MDVPFIIQKGPVFARRKEQNFEAGNAITSIPGSSVGANLVCSLSESAPFDGIIDEQGTYWQLKDRDVVYSGSSVTLNLYSIYETRNLITSPSTITISNGTDTLVLSRDSKTDSLRGYAWRDGNAVVYTDSPVAAVGIDWYADPELNNSCGVTTGRQNPAVTSAYNGGWKACFSKSPETVTYSTVSTGAYSVLGI